MSARGQRVLVAMPDTHLRLHVVRDLAAAGFDVEVARGGRDALAAARRRPPAAVLGVEGLANGWVARASRDPALASVPAVGVTALAAAKPRFVPAFLPVRWDRVLRPDDAYEPGRPAAVVAEAIARGRLPPPAGRERLGYRLYRGASVLVTLTYAALAGWLVDTAISGARRLAPGAMVAVLSALALGNVAGDVGARLISGRRPGVRWGTWLLVGVAAAAAVLRVVSRGAAP